MVAVGVEEADGSAAKAVATGTEAAATGTAAAAAGTGTTAAGTAAASARDWDDLIRMGFAKWLARLAVAVATGVARLQTHSESRSSLALPRCRLALAVTAPCHLRSGSSLKVKLGWPSPSSTLLSYHHLREQQRRLAYLSRPCHQGPSSPPIL